MPSEPPPSKGERNAIIGYKPQYEIAAIKIITAIKAGNLVSIKIADPDAGRVDDFQILSINRIDAYQIKWSEYPSSITYNKFISPIDGNPCYIAQLADGWKRLKNKFPSKKICVHFIHRNYPSTNDKINSCKKNNPDRLHFASFIAQIWNKIHNSSPEFRFQIPDEWDFAFQKFYESSKLETIEEFINFVKDCSLEFGYNIPNFEELPEKDRFSTIDDINNISKKLIDLVADPSKTIEYSLKEFLIIIGWESRNDLINQHLFPINERLYQKNHNLYTDFDNLINNINKGYIGLIGTPGSGKSTFLTQFLKNRSELVIKYYSYIPNSYEPVNLRGESKNFLHDISLQLDHEGFSSGGSVSSFDRTILLKRFYNQMQYLHEEWKKNQRKTIFLIDGLDHISREQHPEYSLLNDLPDPNKIPDGIIFILGSQTDEIFPSAVKSEIRDKRIIEMPSLNLEEVRNIIKNSPIQIPLEIDQINKIFLLSNGHPLSLIYLLNKILETEDNEEISNILNKTNPFSGNIEKQYESYWDELKDDFDLIKLLGLIARCKSGIDLKWFNTWYDRKSISKLRRTFSHYFKVGESGFWFFFHNSFRSFIIKKTSEIESGIIDESQSIYFQKILANQASQEPKTSIHSWDIIFHLFNAKEYQKVIEISTASYFREQFLNFRAIREIKNDIIFALDSAKILNNYHRFIRLMLIGSEYEQRKSYLEDISYFPLLFHHLQEHPEICIEHLISGNELQIEQIKGIKLTKTLNHISFQISKLIFELSEPYDILISSETYNNFQKYSPDTLLTWASSAPYFRTIDEIIKLIRNCKQINLNESHDLSTENIIKFQQKLLFIVGISLIELNKWEDVKIINNEINKISSSLNKDIVFNLNIWSSDFCILINNLEEAEYFLEKVKDVIGDSYLFPENEQFNAERIIYFLYNALKIKKDETFAQKYLKHVQCPENINFLNFSNPFSEFESFIRYNKIQFLLGYDYQPLELNISNENEEEILFFLFKRHIYTLSYISVMGDINKELPPEQISELIIPILGFYYQNFSLNRRIKNGYFIHQCQKEFFEFFVDSVVNHKNGIKVLYLLLDKEWEKPDNEKYWPSLVWENIIKIIYKHSGDKKWCNNKVNLIEESFLSRPEKYYDTNQRIHEFYDYSEICAIIKNQLKSLQYLRKTFETSLGIGFRKDYQLNNWIKWLDIINKIDPEQREERTIFFINIISVMHEYVEKNSDLYAAKLLISVTFNWSPEKALILAEWFITKHIVPYLDVRNLYLSLLLKSELDIPINDILPHVESILFDTENETEHREIVKNL
ncbi:ATP-binding protein [Methanospirillum purgamenti]|uniref:ATP-binding protein n=1 Tax=Methanospirillum hungatei TaxID=2203 RepID=A0A8F5VQI1_METHU|nr:ATP-binding protein [Methanospirillum hungatei]QXO95373.1 ATP-binding protein [Methanospirillum hungatei]